MFNNRPELPIASERESLKQNTTQGKRDINNINIHINPRMQLNPHENDSEWHRAVARFKRWTPHPQNFA